MVTSQHHTFQPRKVNEMTSQMKEFKDDERRWGGCTVVV